MHDLDRTQLETSWETYEYGPGELGQYESEYPGELPGETGPYESEYPELWEGGPYESQYPGELPGETGPYESEYPLNEADEMELASELLGVTNEQELDQFFGKFIRKIGRGIVRVARSPVGRILGGALKAIAKKALPVVGGVFGGPVGAMAASSAGKMFGLELEGLSEEDRDFEIARQYVRFATVATLGVGRTPPGTPPRVAVHQAIDTAARKYAPGLAGATIRPAAGPQPATSGEVAAKRPPQVDSTPDISRVVCVPASRGMPNQSQQGVVYVHSGFQRSLRYCYLR